MSCDDYCCNHGCNQGKYCPARKTLAERRAIRFQSETDRQAAELPNPTEPLNYTPQAGNVFLALAIVLIIWLLVWIVV